MVRHMSKQPSPKDPHGRTSLRKALGFPVRFPRIYRAALTHPSFRNENVRITKELEVLTVWNSWEIPFSMKSFAKKLFEKFPEADEGMLSKLRSILVSQKILSRIAQDLKLQHVLLISKNLRQNFKDFLKAKLLTDALEALFAAIYFDHGHAKVETFILKHFKKYFDPKLLFPARPKPQKHAPRNDAQKMAEASGIHTRFLRKRR